jgi:hypothetical protein
VHRAGNLIDIVDGEIALAVREWDGARWYAQQAGAAPVEARPVSAGWRR